MERHTAFNTLCLGDISNCAQLVGPKCGEYAAAVAPYVYPVIDALSTAPTLLGSPAGRCS
jgi:hypothetical protein